MEDVILADRIAARGIFPSSESRPTEGERCDPYRPFVFITFDVSVADLVADFDLGSQIVSTTCKVIHVSVADPLL